MIVVVDTNILFSACLSPDGHIFEILFNSSNEIRLVGCCYSIEELQRHKAKLIKLSHHSTEETELLLETILKQIEFYELLGIG